VQRHPFVPDSVYVVISRFGVMLFDDPVAAFANLRRATRRGGRLAVAVWLPRDASERQRRSVDVALATARPAGHELVAGPPDGGPFAFGIERHTRRVLARAGWEHVVFTRHDLPF
jgi:SAM-dependent methyltransferase